MSAKIKNLRVIVGGLAVVAAGASGYFMQTGILTGSQSIASAPSVPTPATAGIISAASNIANIEGSATFAPVVPTQPIIETVTRAATPSVLALPTTAPAMLEAPQPEAITLASTETEAASTPELFNAGTPSISECETGFTVMAAPGAMVDLTLEAPCYALQMVDIFHAGMRFSETLDANGLLKFALPVMEEDAFFNVLFADGHTESTDILMLTVNDYHRVALFWKGDAGFDLYALENGALYGEAGHVSVNTPFNSARGLAGEGGYLAEFGHSTSGYHTLIYSYPVLLTDMGPFPEVSVEVQVIEGNCDSEVSATLMRNSNVGSLESLPLIMAVPSCDAVGEYLVLKNLPQVLRIAGN